MNEEKTQTLIRELSDPFLAAGMTLMISQMMRQMGITEFKMIPDAVPVAERGRINFESQGTSLIARLEKKD